jgi:hypothetical protein
MRADLAVCCWQDAGFLAYYHLTGEQPVDLTTIRERLMPGTTQVRAPLCTLRPAALPGDPAWGQLHMNPALNCKHGGAYQESKTLSPVIDL